MSLSSTLRMFLNTDSPNNTNVRSGLYITNKVDITNKERVSDAPQMKEASRDTHEPTRKVFWSAEKLQI